MENFTGVLKKYSDFKSRSSRREFWMFVLFSTLFSIVFSIIDSILNLKVSNDRGMLSSIFSIAVIIPTLAVLVRRLHDTNHSAWWSAFFFVPLLGFVFPLMLFSMPSFVFLYATIIMGAVGLGVLIAWITILIFLIQDSTPGENKYGPNPKTITSPASIATPVV